MRFERKAGDDYDICKDLFGGSGLRSADNYGLLFFKETGRRNQINIQKKCGQEGAWQ